MPWVRFTGAFDYHVPGKLVTIAYKVGHVKNVTTPCANQAKAAGKAVTASRDRKHETRSPLV